MNERTAIITLKEVKTTFDNHGVKFWLNYGTLLGAIQQDSFFEWDIDIDISTWYKNIKTLKEIARALNHQHFDVTFTHDTMRLNKNGIHIDVYLYRYFEDCRLATKTNIEIRNLWGRIIHYLILEGASLIYISPKKTKKDIIIRRINLCIPRWFYKFAYKQFLRTGNFYYRKAVPASHFLTLSKIKFYGLDFNIPSVPKKYLEYIYGNTWNKQIRDWDVLNDSKQAYPKLHVQCPKCKANYSLESKKFKKPIKIKCPLCHCKWIEQIFIMWTINSKKYNPFEATK